jgi:flotillin
MSTMQESLKASSGLDVKELIENLSGKRNIRASIDELIESRAVQSDSLVESK